MALLRWSRLAACDPEAYIRKMMVNRNISLWRKRRSEQLTGEMPDSAQADDHRDEELMKALRRLAPRQRAVIALRILEDLSAARTPELLGCSVGTVKRQTSERHQLTMRTTHRSGGEPNRQPPALRRTASPTQCRLAASTRSRMPNSIRRIIGKSPNSLRTTENSEIDGWCQSR